jgi:hypothetical protein
MYNLIASTGALINDEKQYIEYVTANSSTQGRVLYWQPRSACNPNMIADEEVSFVPHPKTMTYAGEYVASS